MVIRRLPFEPLGGVVLPLILLAQGQSAASLLAMVSAVLCVVAEFLERYLFFTAVVTQKMPGGVAS